MTDKYQRNTHGKEIALEARGREEDRLFSPSAARNRDAIQAVFLEHMPKTGLLLEIGAGTGEHAVHMAAAVPDLVWQPSDPDEISRRSIDAWVRHKHLENLLPPLSIDVASDRWFDAADIPGAVTALLSINMIHIAPFEAAAGLFTGAGNLLPAGGKLFLYGPFKRSGETAPSNLDFDASLKSRDARWGVRDLDLEISPLARQHGLALQAVVEMPANNLSVVFDKN